MSSAIFVMKNIASIFAGLTLFVLLTNICAAETENEQFQLRKQFIAAEKALRANNKTEYQQLRAKLSGYPLIPYLEYIELRRNLNTTSLNRINAFTERYKDMHLASRLRSAYLKRLAEKKSWEQYSEYYQFSDDIDKNCRYQTALYHTGYKEIALKAAAKIWLHSHSLPKSCDPLLAHWINANRPSNELAWQRFDLAINARQHHLAKYLIRFMDESEHALANYWLRLRRDPLRVLHNAIPTPNHRYHDKVRLYATTQTARVAPNQLDQVWSKMVTLRNINENLSQDAINTIAIVLARKHHGDALNWFNRLKESTQRSELSYEWQLRSLLRSQDWPAIRNTIEKLPEEQKNSSQWRYWKARALEKTGDSDYSKLLYNELAELRSYYGFLAADRIEKPYQFNVEILQYTQTELDSVEKLDAIKRIKELIALERRIDARREWYYLLSHLDNEELKKFSALLHQWGWHDRAILTMARSDHRDDLEIRFPLLHQETVKKEAAKYQLDPSLILAMIRQESAYNVRARSHAGARGLMQLMPGTAKNVAKSLKLPLKNNNKLYNAEFNISLGSTYLSQMLNRFDNNSILATAAYNAGPHRVKRWLPESNLLPADIWVDTIPFNETRGYVKNVHAYIAVYNYRQGKKSVMISQQMKPVGPAATAKNNRKGKLLARLPASN